MGSPTKPLVDKIVCNKSLSIYKLSSDIEQCGEALKCLKALADLENEKDEFYSYDVLALLAMLWSKMQKNIPIENNFKEDIANKRMQIFLKYINEHYSEEITLDSLSKSASVSKSECLRCFKKCLNTTPYKYITEYRLSCAANLLKNTTEPINQIAYAVGFNQSSYFGKCFKDKLKCTPKEYRGKMQISIAKTND